MQTNGYGTQQKGKRAVYLAGLMIWVALEIALIRLGLWQLARADEKKTLLKQYEIQSMQPFRELSDNNLDVIQDYQKVVFKAETFDDLTLFIANEPHLGQDGYHVLSAVKLQSSDRVVWINRGWVKALSDRRHIPEVPLMPQHSLIKGEVYKNKGKPILFAEALTQISESVWLLQGRDHTLSQDILKTRQTNPLPYIIRLSPNSEHGFVRDWSYEVTMPVEKHIAYAIQWFGLAFTLLVMSVFFIFKRLRSKQ